MEKVFPFVVLGAVATLVFVMMFQGCHSPGDWPKVTVNTDYVCKTDEVSTKQRADFVLDCVKNANPKSDEEPEDWIPACENAAEKILCARDYVAHVRMSSEQMSFRVACRDATLAPIIAACTQSGWARP